MEKGSRTSLNPGTVEIDVQMLLQRITGGLPG